MLSRASYGVAVVGSALYWPEGLGRSFYKETHGVWTASAPLLGSRTRVAHLEWPLDDRRRALKSSSSSLYLPGPQSAECWRTTC